MIVRNGHADEFVFVQAREASLDAVNRLIARSKAYWDWPDEYLSLAIQLLRISPSYLDSNSCFEILSQNGDLVAFLSLAVSDTKVLIDYLWVAPENIRQGIGRKAVLFALGLAHARGWKRLWVLPDPPAEGFYKALGFVDTGERLPSRIPGGPVFSVFSVAIPGSPVPVHGAFS